MINPSRVICTSDSNAKLFEGGFHHSYIPSHAPLRPVEFGRNPEVELMDDSVDRQMSALIRSLRRSNPIPWSRWRETVFP